MYSNVEEIESALDSLAAAYGKTAEILHPPHRTHEGRAAPLLRIGACPADGADGVLLLGGLHAREWIPPDALISLAADLLEAQDRGLGLGYGQAHYSAEQIGALIGSLNIFVYPCVNPDGRAHSQSVDGNWRKNRRPPPQGQGGVSCHGVDLNRNFDFLWDHSAKFAPDAGVRTSANPCDPQVYRGPAPTSEPETQNVVWALDSFPRIRWLIDVHSAVPVILHPWGSDQNQTEDPAQSFANAAFDGVRGRPDDASYREFIPAPDLGAAARLSTLMNDAVRAVRGTDYGVEQAYGLYPTSGTSDDYAYSRHLADSARTKVLGFCIECGSSFQPPIAEAEEVIREVSSGLIAFGLNALAVTDGPGPIA